jgi:UDP-N-acetylmuramoylalanine--D-glutamate ligase
LKPRPEIPAGPYLVVGLARSGVAAARALVATGGEVVGVDRGAPAGARELAQVGVELYLEQDGVALLDRARAVIKSPGVPSDAQAVVGARARGLPVLGELELGWRLLGNEFVAVTGTNGKTTTVELIGHIHREAGLAAVVAGNVGTAVSSLVGVVPPAATIVCEVSSFQLQDTIAFAPEAAVLLNLAPDHLDRHGTMEDYVRAKLEVFARQGNDDIAVAARGLGVQDLGGCARRVCFGTGSATELSEHEGTLWWEEQPLVRVAEIGLRGAHNVRNAMAAAAVCLARGIDVDAVRAGLRSFQGVAHRLEEIGGGDGVLYVNDSKATNVASTLVALDAFAQTGRRQRESEIDAAPDSPAQTARQPAETGRRVHLILGGQAKGQDFQALCEPVGRNCRAVYLIGQDAPAIASALHGAGVPVHECGALERAFAAAATAAVAGDVVLLSPACASFDQFSDFEARGERFRKLVQG